MSLRGAFVRALFAGARVLELAASDQRGTHHDFYERPEGRVDALPEWLRERGFEVAVLDDETGERTTVEEVLDRVRRDAIRPLRVFDLHARRREGA